MPRGGERTAAGRDVVGRVPHACRPHTVTPDGVAAGILAQATTTAVGIAVG
jgi:hypothetical protein